MTPKYRTLEGKNWTLGGMGGEKLSKKKHDETFVFD